MKWRLEKYYKTSRKLKADLKKDKQNWETLAKLRKEEAGNKSEI